MTEDGAVDRVFAVTGEALYRPERVGITRAGTMGCKVADDPVVVMKFRPMKASNGVEGKTGMNLGEIRGDRRRPKAVSRREGVKPEGRPLENENTKHWSTSNPTC